MINKRENRETWLFFLLFQLVFTLECMAANVSTIHDSEECGGEYSGNRYTITSPNYPQSYPDQKNCFYTLHGSRFSKCEQIFNLEFLDFSLPPSENCNEDYLEIGDRSLYCGRVVGVRGFTGKANRLVLRFHSGAKPGNKGFKILVTTLPCSQSQIDEKNRAESTERDVTSLINKVNENEFANGRDISSNEPESVIPLEAIGSYPIDQPDIDFTPEEVASPPGVASLDDKENNTSMKTQVNPRRIIDYPANHQEIPVNRNASFRYPINVEIVTPSSVRSIASKPSKISAYLFVPPSVAEKSVMESGKQTYSKNNVDSPLGEILLPTRESPNFREINIKNISDPSSFQSRQKTNAKLVIPARSYGAPEEPYIPSYQSSEQDIKTGEVQDNTRIDCQGKNNLEPDLEVTKDFRINVPGSIGNSENVGNSYYSGAISSFPVYPSYTPNVVTTNKYGPPDGSYSNDNFPVISECGQSNGCSGLNYPISPFPGFNGRYSECCNNVYSGQRFLLASPGFPSLYYQTQSYDCIYTIRPSSSNVCGMRFNFKFFNHGTEDRYCNNGYVEIDGRRICGCKKGLSIVSSVMTSYPKIIGVRYTGYPRNKFNGFLIEVIQEACNNGYPNLSRSKKDIGNFSQEIQIEYANSPVQRTKRNVGYNYPKPKFGLNEDPSSSWNSLNTHQQWNQGISNLFAPLLSCQAFNFFDWSIAAKETYFRNGRCVKSNVAGYPGYQPSNWIPVNPSIGNSGSLGYPGNGGVPGIISTYPGNVGVPGIIPEYPNNVGVPGPIPEYPGNGATSGIIPGYPGNGAASGITPGYPGNGGVPGITPGYPSNGGVSGITPGYPGNGGVPGITSGYPGAYRPVIPIYPGNESPGIIGPGYPGGGTIVPENSGSGGWNFPTTKCEDVNVIEGLISSPQYPSNYPLNLKKCFRFYKAPDYCQLELDFLDFDLENSVGCTKDYVIFSGQNRRYCSRSLAGSKWRIDISRSNTFDMCFVSDSFVSGRGFNVGFYQISCRSLTNR